MEFKFNPDILLPVSGAIFLLFLVSLPWVCRHTDFVFVLRQHLRRFAPLYFVVGPSAMTYYTVCGAVSASVAVLFTIIDPNNSSQEYANHHGIYNALHCVEYACSFVGASFFAWLIRWVGLSRLWTIMLFVSLCVCAAYRTARVGTGPYFGTGPAILLSPQWLDTIPVALGLCFYLLLSQKLDKRQRSGTCPMLNP